MTNKLEISSYSSLKLDIANELTYENIESIKFLLREAKIGNKDYKIGKRDLEKVNTGCQLMEMLEERNLISSESVENVSILLINVKRHDLDVKVQDYIGQIISSSPTKHVSDIYGLAGMHINDNYVETSEFGKLHKHLQNHNVAILKGPPGSWKSQHAFRYARILQERDDRSLKWRINCNKAIDIYNSFSHLINYLKLRCVHSSSCVKKSIHNMIEEIINNLETCENSKHLFILHGSLSPQLNLLDEIMRRFKACSNILVIVTTVQALSPEWNKYVIHLNGMTKEEAVDFLGSNEDDSLEDIADLAGKVGYLPDGLLYVRTYLEMAKISVRSYLNDLERMPVTHLYVDGACEMLLNLIQEKLSPEEKWIFNLFSYINTNKIDIFIVQELLLFYYSEFDKETGTNKTKLNNIVDEFLIKLSNYSVININGRDNNRIIKADPFTFTTLNAMKSPNIRRLEAVSLLNFFTRHLDVDSRLLKVINRNILLLAHAETMLNTCEKYFQTMSVEVKAMYCYVLCAVGIAYRYYGNTELSADTYFQRAKHIIYKYFLDIIPPSFCKKDDPMTTMSEYLVGHWSIQEHAKDIFTKLLETGTHISDEFIDEFIKNKYRTEEEINLLCKYAGIPLRHHCGHRVLGLIDILRKQNLIMCAEKTSETFLVELTIRILYNESKSKWLISLSEEELKTPPRVLRDHLVSSYYPVTSEILELHQLAHNLTVLLEKHMIKILPDYPDVDEQFAECKISKFSPIFSPVTIRNGILYMLRSVTDINLPNLLKEALELLEQIDADIQGVGLQNSGW